MPAIHHVGQRFQAWRQQSGMSIEAIAIATKINEPFIRKLEDQKLDPEDWTNSWVGKRLYLLTCFCNLPSRQLFGGLFELAAVQSGDRTIIDMGGQLSLL